MNENQTYLLKEFDKLNGKVAKLLEETRSREKYSLTIIAAVSAWIYTATFGKKTETTLGQAPILGSNSRVKLDTSLNNGFICNQCVTSL